MKNRVVVWAVDPFQKDLAAYAAAIPVLNSVATSGAEVQPVYVWSGGVPGGLKLSSGFCRKLANRGDAILRKLTGSRLRPTLRKLTVVETSIPGATQQATRAVEVARRYRAVAIVVSQAQTRGFTKWMLGSFAENVLELADLPVILTPIKPKKKSPRGGFLVATDFSIAADEAIDRVTEVARATGKRVTLFHCVDAFPDLGTAFAFEAGLSLAEAESELLAWAREELKIRVDRLRLRGVRGKAKLDSRRRGRAADRILGEAAKGYECLVVAAHRGVVARVLLGSTTRSLVRGATLPLWVHKPSAKVARKARSAKSDGLLRAPKLKFEPTYLV